MFIKKNRGLEFLNCWVGESLFDTKFPFKWGVVFQNVTNGLNLEWRFQHWCSSNRVAQIADHIWNCLNKQPRGKEAFGIGSCILWIGTSFPYFNQHYCIFDSIIAVNHARQAFLFWCYIPFGLQHFKLDWEFRPRRKMFFLWPWNSKRYPNLNRCIGWHWCHRLQNTTGWF